MILLDILVVCLYGGEVTNMNDYIEYLWLEDKPKFDLSGLEALESEHEVFFPKEFIQIFRVCFGAKLKKSIIPMGEKSDIAGIFLHIQHLASTDKRGLYDIRYQIEEFDGYISKKIIPFMTTQTSNLVCLDFRDDSRNPRVVLLVSGLIEDGEDKAIKFIANDITTFINNLEDPD